MSNFSYLSTHHEYSLFTNSAIEAEKVFSTSPAMCAVGCRKALELAVKWVYAADKTITMPLQGQPAIPVARAELPVRSGPQCVERTAQHREGWQSGGTYGA